VTDVLAALAEATAGPDAPSRYLVDLVVSRLPDGDVRWVAQFLAPSIAAYLQTHVDDIAPRLAPGVRALAAGLPALTSEWLWLVGVDQHRMSAEVLEAVCPWTPWLRATSGYWSTLVGPTGVSAEMQGCVLLYGLTGLTDMPAYSPAVIPTDSIFGSATPALATKRAEVIASQPKFATPLPSGQALKRLKRVKDNLRRELTFTYFATGSNIGLLEKVTGPAGTQITFSYAANPSAPEGLNERFLTSARRDDGPTGSPLILPAGNRGYEYQYAWQTSGQMPSDLGASDAAYTSYFSNIYNCGALTKAPCSDKWQNTVQFANVSELVAQQRRRLFSDAADNITTVWVRDYAGGGQRVESETRYGADAFHPNFDRALAQRWGGDSPTAQPTTHPSLSFSWLTSLPLATFEYAGAAPVNPNPGVVIGDETDTFVPSELRSLYPLETLDTNSVQNSYNKGLLLARNAPTTITQTPPVALGAAQVLSGSTRPACGLHLLPQARTKLPGYKPSLDYFDTQLPTADLATPGVSFSQPLKRSYLSCETLALAESYDVRHNDLASTWHRALGGQYVVESMTGRRKHTAANANRICQWVKYTDRDGDLHFTGLNYQGRPLVSAVRVVEGTPRWKVAETLYNADGNVVSQRRTRTAGETSSGGETRYFYHEESINSGSLGTTRPLHWNRRGNVIRSGTNAVSLNLPRLGGSRPTHVLLRARVGSPVVARGVDYLFGSIISVPDTDEFGTLLSSRNLRPEDYWAAEPHSTNNHAGAPYYWSPNARVVFATKPGAVEIAWRKVQGVSTAPGTIASPGGDGVQGFAFMVEASPLMTCA
jgi:hypothetical protein